MIRYIARKVAATEFARSAVAERADLSAFKARPTPRIICGVSAIAFSYVIGWPLISVCGTLAVYFREPLILGIGGPVAYGGSHLMFLLGMYLAGAEFSMIFFRWATRMAVERYADPADRATPPAGQKPGEPDAAAGDGESRPPSPSESPSDRA